MCVGFDEQNTDQLHLVSAWPATSACTVVGALEKDPTERFKMPSEAVIRRDRILGSDELEAFWKAYRSSV